MNLLEKGGLIVLDGGEGCGKSTLESSLKELYRDKIVVTREPGGSHYAEEIRKIILESPNAKQANADTMFHLFWAARADHLKNIIIPAVQAGKIVICGRFDSSTFAYQIVAQGAKYLEELFWRTREHILKGGKYEPDVYVYLDLDPEIGLARKKIGDCEKNHFDERELKFHQDLRTGFKQFFAQKNYPINRLGKTSTSIIIDANQSKEKVFEDFNKILLVSI